MAPFLSVIVPAYNEERRLPQTLRRIADYLASQGYESEIIVVDDGSLDRTAQVVEEMQNSLPTLHLLRLPHRGKGHAVKTGMLSASGAYRFLSDADLSMPVEEMGRFLPPQLQGVDVAIGSREAPGARRYHEPTYRHLMGRIFNWVVRFLTVRGIQDTQCGFKCFSQRAAQDIFPYQTMDGWGFDVEVLFIAQRRGYRIVELPIDWYYMANSRVRPLQDSLGMLGEVIKIRINDLRGLYNL
ncbi:MAG: glycosyltransferase family 2 protein [Chloroflexi bacterium]|nr:glycosyltransferase family 2 protein [Chloroflexota bacterium]